jgi:hypothetical protein
MKSLTEFQKENKAPDKKEMISVRGGKIVCRSRDNII